MGFTYRKRIPILGRLLGVNIGRRGVTSVSGRVGPISANSRGRWSINLPGGWSWRGRWGR